MDLKKIVEFVFWAVGIVLLAILIVSVIHIPEPEVILAEGNLVPTFWEIVAGWLKSPISELKVAHLVLMFYVAAYVSSK